VPDYSLTGAGGYLNGTVVTPSDSTELTARALWVGGAGSLTAVLPGNDTVTFKGIAAGTLLPIPAVKVKADTSATLIVALW
jgi:hypothetical protein